jgi:murein tripeptide amidase MpaA
MRRMPTVEFNRYYRYDELVNLLRAFEEEFPQLVSLESLGKSYEGRDIFLVTVTQKATGPADSKPAFWCDGNIHASEVSASTAVLYLLHRLVTGYGRDDFVTKCIDTRALYLVPRVCPDGAEWALSERPRIIRSSTRPYPYDEEDFYGIEQEDIDGDGRILQMRVKDPNGNWKISEEEPRLMVRRDPAEYGGEYYRLLPEGRILNYDGFCIRARRRKENLDLNRNFPSHWRLESEQKGAGPYPTSEPEVRAIVDAICKRPNICGALTFHTFSGVHLRPPSDKPDDEIPAEDLWVYQRFGEKGKELTGYPAIANYHEFRYHPREIITGVFDDWMYEHRGVYAWTTELWSPQREAGITDYKYIDWFREHPFEHDKLLLKWSDEVLGGKGYVDWYEFDHPQLGKVELGGWDAMYAWRNPPPPFLEKEVAPHSEWIIWQALASPKLEIHATQVTGEGTGRERVSVIRVVVDNTGWLPTYVTKLAKEKKLTRGVIGEIELSPEMELLAGKLREEGPELEGRSHLPVMGFGWVNEGTDHRHVFQWTVRGQGKVKVHVSHERAGKASVEIET